MEVFGHKAPFGASGHNHRIFYLLGFYQPQHFGAVILHPVRPAQAAPRHLAAAQVDTFHSRRVHINFKLRPRFWRFRQGAGGQFYRHIRFVVAIRVALEKVGAQGGVNQVQVGAQHLVFVEVGHGIQLGADFLGQPFAAPLLGVARVKVALEQRHQVAGGLQVFGQGIGDKALAEAKAKLLDVLAVHAQHRHRAPVQSRPDHQPVEEVISRFAQPGGAKRLLEIVAYRRHVHIHTEPELQGEVRQVHVVIPGGFDFVGVLAQHAEAEVFQQRHHGRQLQSLALPEHLKAHNVFGPLTVAGKSSWRSVHRPAAIPSVQYRSVPRGGRNWPGS